MSKPRTEKRNEELLEFIRETSGQSYIKRCLGWLKQNINQIVTSEELAQLPGQKNKTISHSMRRIFELRDEEGYEIINHSYENPNGKKLKIDEWMLLNEMPNEKFIRNRGVNKRIMHDVFSRDSHTCKFCGRTPEDLDPLNDKRKIRLHVGHIKAHKRKNNEDYYNMEDIDNISTQNALEVKDFLTMCNVCNEGAKNNDIKIMSSIDKIKILSHEEQKKIYIFLKKKFS